MMNPRLVFGFLALLAVITLAWAKTAEENPHWLKSSEINALVASEPPPPAPGSAAEKSDLQIEVAAQKDRTPAQIAEANTDANYSVALFTGVVGPRITPKADPVTFLFFDRANKQIGKVVGASKDHWRRLRPYLGHPEVIHPLFPASGFSYPSGHATHAYAFAIILGELFPDKAGAFLQRAHEIAQSRVVAGVHYTTDIKEGEVLGREIVREFNTKPEFQKELAEARAELAAQK